MITTSNSRVLVLMALLVGCAPKEADTDPSMAGESTSTGEGTTTDTPTGDPTTGETGE